MKLFVDIDGVLLIPEEGDGPDGLIQKEYVNEFLEWAVRKFDCYWLTSWAIAGHSLSIEKELLPYITEAARDIKIADWSKYKTEALKDPDFIWIDDHLLPEEQKELEAMGWLDHMIKVDPNSPSMKPLMVEIEKRRTKLEKEVDHGEMH